MEKENPFSEETLPNNERPPVTITGKSEPRLSTSGNS
jgi:hypothetical protein